MHIHKMQTPSAAGFLLLLLCVPGLQAQTLTRTFISGLGSDSNPCSRSQPCQTLSGALANTAAGGEIYVLDATELQTIATNPLTISKSVSIIGAGARGGVTGQLIISPPAGGLVVLKGLDINANSSIGISVTTSVGISLVVEDCTIVNGGIGINFTPQASTAASYLTVRNSTIDNNKGVGGTVGGIIVQPGGTGISYAVLDGVHLNGNSFGVYAFDYADVTLRNSVIAQSTVSGVRVQSNSGAAATILVEHSQSSHNTGNGVIAVGSGAVARIDDVTITGNLANGVIAVNGGQVISFGNNVIDGNGANGTPTSTIALK